MPELRDVLRPARGQMLATRPQPPTFRLGLGVDWGTAYWRQTADGVVVLGGLRSVGVDSEDVAVEAVNPLIQGALDRFLPTVFPDLAPAETTQRWAGIMDITPDGRPLVGPMPGTQNRWVAAGFGGHGLPPALGTGRALADGIRTGRLPEPIRRFDPERCVPHP
jgi:sarcosine oxidase subunit beta